MDFDWDFSVPSGVTVLAARGGYQTGEGKTPLTFDEWYRFILSLPVNDPRRRVLTYDIIDKYNSYAAYSGIDPIAHPEGFDFWDMLFGEEWYEFWGGLAIGALGFGIGFAASALTVATGAAITTAIGGVWGGVVGITTGMAMGWTFQQLGFGMFIDDPDLDFGEYSWEHMSDQGKWFMGGAAAGALWGAATGGAKELYDTVMDEARTTIDYYIMEYKKFTMGFLEWAGKAGGWGDVTTWGWNVTMTTEGAWEVISPLERLAEWWMSETPAVNMDFTTNAFDYGGGW